MKKLVLLSAALALTALLAGCSSRDGEEPLPEGMESETLLAAGEEVLDQLLSGEYEAVYGAFREDIQEELTAGDIQALIEAETQETGTYEGIESADTVGSTQGEDHGIARFLCTFSEEEVAINLAFDPDMELIGLSAAIQSRGSWSFDNLVHNIGSILSGD